MSYLCSMLTYMLKRATPSAYILENESLVLKETLPRIPLLQGPISSTIGRSRRSFGLSQRHLARLRVRPMSLWYVVTLTCAPQVPAFRQHRVTNERIKIGTLPVRVRPAGTRRAFRSVIVNLIEATFPALQGCQEYGG